MNWEDAETLQTLEYGARARSTPPTASMYFPNHRSTQEFSGPLDALLEDEVMRGWVVRTFGPPCIPICIRPLGVVPKTAERDGIIVIRGHRLITDGSFPKKCQKGASVSRGDGSEQWLAPNFNYPADQEPWLRFPSIWELAQASEVLHDLAGCTSNVAGMPVAVVGKCLDFEKWFRQIPMSNLDRWQIMETWKGV